MGVILFGIYIVLSIVLTVIGVFIGNIIFFDSILLAALSGLLCHYGQSAFQGAGQLCITPVCHRLECHFPACSTAFRCRKLLACMFSLSGWIIEVKSVTYLIFAICTISSYKEKRGTQQPEDGLRVPRCCYSVSESVILNFASSNAASVMLCSLWIICSASWRIRWVCTLIQNDHHIETLTAMQPAVVIVEVKTNVVAVSMFIKNQCALFHGVSSFQILPLAISWATRAE